MAQVRKPRSAHPGVSFVRRKKNGELLVRARWTDPDTRDAREHTFRENEDPRTWMIEKSLELAQRRRDLAKGAAPHTGQTLREAVEGYFETRGSRLQGSTAETYRAACSLFLEWSATAGVRSNDELRSWHLTSFVDWLAARPAKGAVSGGRRDERADTDRRCSPGGVNNRLRSVKAILNQLRRQGRLPYITSDHIKDALKPLKAPRPRPRFLRSAEIGALVQAALRHDAETFNMTRDEKAARTAGNTAKYVQIAPFVIFMLLTGCRLEEALRLMWNRIDFDAKDERGRKVGEIVLKAQDVKTGHERVIDLAICPGLKKILLGLKVRAAAAPYVFGGDEPWSRPLVESARHRLVSEFGAPEFCWSQTEGDKPALRATCATFVTNSCVYPSASAFHSAKRLGHSVVIAERHYLGLIRGIPRKAKTLEQAMEIKGEIDEAIARLTGQTKHPVPRGRGAKGVDSAAS